MTDRERRFTVLWKSRNRERHSAMMTKGEAETFAGRLRGEEVEDVTIREDKTVPFALLRARYALSTTMARPAAAVAARAGRFQL
jgi:hypothetical protein